VWARKWATCVTLCKCDSGSKVHIICASILIKWALCVILQQTRALALDFHIAILKHMRRAPRSKHKYVCTLLYWSACTLRFMAYAMCLLLGVNGHVPRQRKLRTYTIKTHTSYRGGSSSSTLLTSRTIRQSVLLEECVSKYCVVQMRRRECAIRTMGFSWWHSALDLRRWNISTQQKTKYTNVARK
jgi:hypothetical protein